MTLALIEQRKKDAVEASKRMKELLEAGLKTAEDEQSYNDAEKRYDDIVEKEIPRLERSLKRAKQLDDWDNESGKDPGIDRPGADGGKRGEKEPDAEKRARERSDAYRSWLLNGVSQMSPQEMRALQIDPGAAGGILLAPEQMIAGILSDLTDEVVIRSFATVIPLTQAESLGVVQEEDDFEDAEWTTELGIGGEDDTEPFGKRAMTPQALAKVIKISKPLLRKHPQIEQYALGKLATKFAHTEENHFMTGHGVGQPLGIFTASEDGIPTTRDTAGSNTTTDLHPDSLYDCLYFLKEGHQKAARWLASREWVKRVRKMKDGNGQYLWQPGITNGQPATIVDRPYTMSEFAPNTFSTGAYVAVLGNFKYYWICQALSLQFERLVELYAGTNQIGLVGRMEIDGQPVQPNAFVRMKLA